MDPSLIAVSFNRQILFACHHYMSQVPLVWEVATGLGGFPLDYPTHRKKHFF
ncbi:hypothetical protein [Dapis sp. BLCC M126]|uniref:hypothetical protein n=1 Tax=Dapis sp. BLCC M126 TaxID=3400189 RepID=UPI003CF7D982